jgi:hypothetical protein
VSCVQAVFLTFLPALCKAVLSLATTETGSLRECSHIRCTLHSLRRSKARASLSLILFRRILGFQYVCRDLGMRQCHRQPCQKQPSTNTASRSRRKTKSGFPGNPCCRRHPVRPFARSMAASRSSVARLPVERIAAMTFDRFCLVRESVTGIFFRRRTSRLCGGA